MITVKVHSDSIEAIGHANYSTHGNDIVCAAVSTLMQTLELRGMAFKESGNMVVFTEDKAALELITEGLKQIADNFSDYVEVVQC